MKTKLLSGLVVVAAAMGVVACGGGARQSANGAKYGGSATAPEPGGYAPAPAQESEAPHASADVAPSPAAPAATPSPAAGYGQPGAEHGEAGPAAKKAERSAMPAPSERPGLGTEWGERRFSHVSHATFYRADPDRPTAVASLFYNDREGARAMTRYADYREVGPAVVRVGGMDITVSLRDDHGDPLQAFFADGKTYAIGEHGRRYTILVRNNTGLRIETVGSVDGLDVLDGKAASPSKRGYLVPAWGSLEIDGWRQTDDHVAAFRFGSVRDSYAARTGSDRNVGVIGMAVFHERGTSPWPWTRDEVDRRNNADPFPGRYASPPPPRW